MIRPLGSGTGSIRRCAVSKLIGATVLLAGAAGLAWWYWQEANRPNAEAWAAGTDRLR